ncbi:phosphoenolpyruvate kinase, partial [bacterium]|nr:phosphoenolpyruvate kinase [bacterium]
KLDFDHIRHSLFHAFYQGWDLHRAQFPIRYAANYSFFLESFVESANRLKNFVEKAAQATLSGDVFDDAATGQGLLNYFLRALNSGALDEKDIELTGLTLEEIQTRSFFKILEMRSQLD